MKKILILFSLTIITIDANCQEVIKNDTLFKLNEEIIVCKVTNISEFEIVYSFVGESLTNTISKKQLKEIHFGSGRVQKISDLIAINGEEDWEKVQLTTLQIDVVGLTKKGEVKGKAMGTALANMTKVKKRAEEQIKREAAKLGAHIVFMQAYNTTDSQPGISFGKANINGIAYGYK
jgi:hypothetical protein